MTTDALVGGHGDVILAVDPGQTTGLAWVRLTELDDPPQTAELDWVAAMDFVHQNQDRWFAVVCESYVITQATLKKSRGQNWSIEQIGILRYLCLRRSVLFQLQTPSDAKAFSTDAKLRHLGWWQPGKGHGMDAARHLLLYLIWTRLLDPDRLAGLVQ